MTPLLIAISGKKNSGKDTLCDYCIQQLQVQDWSCEKLGFATELKRQVHVLFGVPYNILYGDNETKGQLCRVKWEDLPFKPTQAWIEKNGWHNEIPRGYMTVRSLLQIWGTEIVRSIYNNAWVDALIVNAQSSFSEIIFVNDCRFPNELEGIQANGGVVLRLTRAIYEEDQHESETALDQDVFDWARFDRVIPNHGMNLEDTRHVVWEYVKYCAKGYEERRWEM